MAGFLGLALLLVVTPVEIQGQSGDTLPDSRPGQGDSLSIADLEAAEARLRAAIQVTPDIASFHASLGEILHSQGRLQEARTAFAEAVRIEPSNPTFRGALGTTALALGEWAEAETHFAWAVQLVPDDPNMHLGLGEAILAQGRATEAGPHIRRAAALATTDPGIRSRAEVLLPRTSPSQGRTPFDIALAITLKFLTFLSMAVLSIAGLGMVIPVAAAVLLLVVIIPYNLIRGRRLTR